MVHRDISNAGGKPTAIASFCGASRSARLVLSEHGQSIKEGAFQPLESPDFLPHKDQIKTKPQKRKRKTPEEWL